MCCTVARMASGGGPARAGRARPGTGPAARRAGGVAAGGTMPRCLDSADMTGTLSGVVLVAGFGVVAVLGVALVVVLFRISGRPESGGPDADAAARRR